MLPSTVLSAWEQFLHQFILGADVHVDHAFTQSELATAHHTFVQGSLSVTWREKFHKAVHRLASGTIHDDVDGKAEFGGDDFRIAAEEAENFLFREGVWYLLHSGQLLSPVKNSK